MSRLEAIDAELRLLETRRAKLLREREHLQLEGRRDEATEVLLSPDEKIALFLSLFRCREDVYPRLEGHTHLFRNVVSFLMCKRELPGRGVTRQ